MENQEYEDLNNRIEKYSNSLIHSDYGSYHHLPKEFVRINDNTTKRNDKIRSGAIVTKKTAKDSLYFGGLFRSLMSKDNHYITYLNESFNCKKSEIVIPDSISCLVKDYGSVGSERCYFECVGSRLANAFGVESVYNVAVASEVDEYDDSPNYDTLISVDYVPYGYKTETMRDLGIDFNEDSHLSDIMADIDRAFPRIAKEKKLNLTKEGLQNLKEKFALQFLFRSLICEDYDFVGKNTSILMGENGDFRLAPAYDMELLFDGAKSQGYYLEMAEDAIGYMQNNMPDTLNKFIKNMHSQFASGKIDKILDNTLKVSRALPLHLKKNLTRNSQRLTDVYKEIQMSSEMQSM